MSTEEIIRQLKIAQARFMMVEKQRPAIFKAIKIIKDNEWISVDDRLPDEYGVYVTYTAHGDVCVDYYNPTDNGESGDFRNTDDITHWKPLPEPPK